VNLGNPVEFTIGQLAETVISLTGSSSKIAYRPLPEDDPRQRCPDISLAQKLLTWAPRVQLRDGLMKTIEYFEQLLRSDARDERLLVRSAKAGG
jgi:UDP-glucuronate decarboxylase